MIYLINNNIDPALNHAIEEFFLKDTKEEVFTLWRNSPTVLLGKNQNAYSELDIDFANKDGIKIVRRLSGGGTVYCDLNNMQYSFITSMKKTERNNPFELFARPVVEFLKNLGLDAEFTGRNDILISGKKISGNAQYRYKDRILHHGTILFDVDKDKLSRVLRSRPIKFKGKSVKSVSSRVGTIKEILDGISINEFMKYLSEYIIDFYKIDKIKDIDDEILLSSNKYIERFKSLDWNLGKDINYYNELSIKYPFGLVEYKLKLKNGSIDDINILGDFFSDDDMDLLKKELLGRKLEEKDLKAAIDNLKISRYINGMTNDKFISDLVSMYKGA